MLETCKILVSLGDFSMQGTYYSYVSVLYVQSGCMIQLCPQCLPFSPDHILGKVLSSFPVSAPQIFTFEYRFFLNTTRHPHGWYTLATTEIFPQDSRTQVHVLEYNLYKKIVSPAWVAQLVSVIPIGRGCGLVPADGTHRGPSMLSLIHI